MNDTYVHAIVDEGLLLRIVAIHREHADAQARPAATILSSATTIETRHAEPWLPVATNVLVVTRYNGIALARTLCEPLRNEDPHAP